MERKKQMKPHRDERPFRPFSVTIGRLSFHYRPIITCGQHGYSVFGCLEIVVDDLDPSRPEYHLVAMDVAYRAAMDTDQLDVFNI